MAEAQAREGATGGHDKLLFWGCFMALIATAFGFVVRGMLIDAWGMEFNLSQTEKGAIFGAGLWPFAVSMVLFSLIIDKIGYGRAMVFAFVCHVTYAIMTIFATGYTMLYIASFIFALGNGTVEAVINPVVATMFAREKTKWLNILHAGWPGGLVFGGLLAIGLGTSDWRIKVGLILIPAVLYAIMLMGRKFPVHERVAAGVSYKDMLREAGAIGALIVVTLMTWQLADTAEGLLGITINSVVRFIFVLVVTAAYGFYVQGMGRPLFIFLVLIMMPLAITELGTDSWITALMTSSMVELGLNPGWLLVYTSLIMMILRFCAGPIVHKLSPLGLLAACAAIAAVGLFLLSSAAGVMILVAATIYGLGKTFFWPTMLGIVGDQFPRGGALTINSIAAVGMLSVGIVGAPLLGIVQDRDVDQRLAAHDQQQGTALHGKYMMEVHKWGQDYMGLDQDKIKTAAPEEKTVLDTISTAASKNALKIVAIFPIFMCVCYVILIVYFKSRGGYEPVHLEGAESGSGH